MMTKEERQLLLVDLCARLSYGVICCVTHKKNSSLVKEDMKLSGTFENGNFYFLDEMGSTYSDDYIPYLRPMQTITDKEIEERNQIALFHSGNIASVPTYMDWLNAHHFDYRGLIEKGLALEAPEGMYNNNKD